jgi:hypothetical protein
MKACNRLMIALSGVVVAAAMVIPASAGATVHAGTAAKAGRATIAAKGMGRASAPRVVNVRAAAAGPQIRPHFRSVGPLGRNGKVAGSNLPVIRSTGVRPQQHAVAGGPNAGQAPRLHLRIHNGTSTLSPFAAVNQNFEGVTQGGSNCGCQPPDVNAAVSGGQIAEVVNLRLQVYKKSGAGIVKCGVPLNTLLGTSASLSDPRIQWDNVNKRFSMVVIPVPSSPSATPQEFVLATTTSSACGSWFVFDVGFSGGLFPAGTLLDYPYLGEDNSPSATSAISGAILSATNNFCCAPGFNSYIGTAAFAIPKAPVYSGLGFSFPAFSTGSFSTAPVTVSGKGKTVSANTYWLSSVPGSGYNLFVMTNSANPGSTTFAFQAGISSPFNAPSRRVNQPCGSSCPTLDPLDGRIVWAPEMGGSGFIWFTHGIDDSGFPTILYGAISVVSNTATVAEAFHSGTSDDFNPSIAVTPTSGSLVFIWLNWAYDDAPNGVATSDTTNGVLPGGGVPPLTSGDLVLVNGSDTFTNFRFGDYSSVEVNPKAISLTCPAGRDAALAQEYFDSSSQWVTRIARISFC